MKTALKAFAVISMFSFTLWSIDQSKIEVLEAIHTHKECLKDKERLEMYIEYFKLNNPDLIEAREWVNNKNKIN